MKWNQTVRDEEVNLGCKLAKEVKWFKVWQSPLSHSGSIPCTGDDGISFNVVLAECSCLAEGSALPSHLGTWVPSWR